MVNYYYSNRNLTKIKKNQVLKPSQFGSNINIINFLVEWKLEVGQIKNVTRTL